MKAGNFVASEVPARATLDECWDLVRTKRETKSGYMLLENCRYGEPVMQVANMAAKGLFGDIYPTHSVGPVCGWMGVNRTDRLLPLIRMASKPAALEEYAARRRKSNSELPISRKLE